MCQRLIVTENQNNWYALYHLGCLIIIFCADADHYGILSKERDVSHVLCVDAEMLQADKADFIFPLSGHQDVTQNASHPSLPDKTGRCQMHA